MVLAVYGLTGLVASTGWPGLSQQLAGAHLHEGRIVSPSGLQPPFLVAHLASFEAFIR